jgi:hypothetical protein
MINKKNTIAPKNMGHAVEILQSLLSAEEKKLLLKKDSYSHFGIGLYIRNQLLYLDNPYWNIHSPDDMSEGIYDELMRRLKGEKYFSKELLDNFFNDPEKYASAKCISDENIFYAGIDYRFSKRFWWMLTDKYVLFGKNKTDNVIMLSNGYIYNLKSIFKYSLEKNILNISWNYHISSFEIYKDFDTNFKIKKLDTVGKKLLKIIDLESQAFKDKKKSFGMNIHKGFINKFNSIEYIDHPKQHEYRRREEAETVIKIEDIKDKILKKYFNYKDIQVDVWENTVLMKCFDVNPDDACNGDSIFGDLTHYGIPEWMEKCEEDRLTECLLLWKERNRFLKPLI